jgi:hypothetical protein
LKHHKACFEEKCSKFFDEKKQAKLEWLQNPNEVNGDNLSNVRREASQHFTEKEYLKKLQRLNQPVRIRTSETCTREQIILKRVTNLELTW